MVLRQPVERAYSAFVMYRRDNRESSSNFLDAIEQKDQVKHHHGEPGVYLERSYYSESLERYTTLFGRENIQIHLYEDFKQQPEQVLDAICRHLGVDGFQPDMSMNHNVGGLHRSNTLKMLLTRPNPLRFLARELLPDSLRVRGREAIEHRDLERAPPISPEIWTKLQPTFREDVLRLQNLIGRDLEHWLRPHR